MLKRQGLPSNTATAIALYSEAAYELRSGGVMVLGKLPVPRRPTNLD